MVRSWLYFVRFVFLAATAASAIYGTLAPPFYGLRTIAGDAVNGTIADQGLIARIPHPQRYRLTDFGLKTSLFCSRVNQRVLRPGLSELCDPKTANSAPLAQALAKFPKALDACTDQKIAA